jgi:uncharacterized membrane protein YhaH (DUF805 family)
MTDLPPPPPSNYGNDGGPPQPVSNPLVGYWKRVVFENYANFAGRARRSEYWWFTLANLIVWIVLVVLSAAVRVFSVLELVYLVALIVPSLAVTFRRLHDTDKSGWWILIGLVPFVGGIILLVFMCTDSTPGTNRYGVSEKYPVR